MLCWRSWFGRTGMGPLSAGEPFVWVVCVSIKGRFAANSLPGRRPTLQVPNIYCGMRNAIVWKQWNGS